MASALPPADHFRTQLQALSSTNQPPPATSFQKPKVVKKVRVQSPPPSPESPAPSDRFPPLSLDDDESSSSDETDEQVEQLDPFTYASSTGSTDSFHRGDELQPIPTLRPPNNPFQKTLRDLEHGVTTPEQTAATAPGTKGVLDVGAFGRLLLTGQAGSAGSVQAAVPNTQHVTYPPIPSGNGPSMADTPFTPRQPRLQAVQETPQTSREASEHETEDDRRGLISSSQSSLQPAPVIVKKKPPPPSSRHGKLIRAEAGGEAKAAASGALPPLSSPARRAATLPPAPPSRQRPLTPSEVNKPLPLAPLKSPAEEDTESIFDREAAGKLPEDIQPGLNIIMPRPPTPPNASHTVVGAPATTPQPAKKPAPPPRRQPHGRSESRVTSSAASAIQQDDTDLSLRRSSADSTRSRSSSLRVSVHAPAPPPPRRLSHQPRAPSLHSLPPLNSLLTDAELSPRSNTIVPSPPPITDTPSSNSSNGTPGTPAPFPPPAAAAASPTTTTTTVNHHPPATTTAAGKLAPPPPPPARNASVRGRGKRPLSSSIDAGAAVSRRSSGREPPPPPRHRDARDKGGRGGGLDGAGAPPASVGGGGDGVAGGLAAGGEEAASHAGDILADLSALQREVDALRGVVEGGGGGGGG
jgi:hypothetical protein